MDPVVGPVGECRREDARRIVHGSAEPARERDDRRVFRRIALAPRLVFRSADAFAGHEIRPRAREAGELDGLMHVERDAMGGGLLHHALVVVDHPLPVMMLALRDDLAGITGLHRVDSEPLVLREGRLHFRLISRDVAARFLVPDQRHAFLPRVRGDGFEVEVGIGFGEAEAVAVEPGLPALVPAFDQQAADSNRRSEINVTPRVVRRCAVGRPRLPRLRADVHAPPDAHVLHGFNPRRVRDLAGLVEILDEMRFDQSARAVRDLDRAPGRGHGDRRFHLQTVRPRDEIAPKREGLPGDGPERHARVIQQGRLVKAQV